MSKRRAVGRLVTVTVLILAIAVPAFAYAATGSDTARNGYTMSNSATMGIASDQRQETLRERIETALRLRTQAFDAVADRLRDRIRSMELLCDRIEEAGGDTARVRQELRVANASLEDALRLETQARMRFRNVPDAESRRSEFGQARELAGEAVGELRQSREQLKYAVQLLRDVTDGLRED